jgi:hypothetical protein
MTYTDDTKQAAAHSPEPWHIEPLQADNGGSVAICNKQQGILAVIPPLNEDDEPDAATAQRDPCDEANARRIVAAVNACEGIGTQALEQGVVSELVEALEDLYNWLTPDWQQSSLGDKARAAIAKATAT